MAEDLDAYFDTALEFAVAATLGAAAVTGIFDSETVAQFGDELVTQAPTFLLRSTEAAGAAAGTALVIGATTYTVRAVSAEPPDGVLTRLVLTRA